MRKGNDHACLLALIRRAIARAPIIRIAEDRNDDAFYAAALRKGLLLLQNLLALHILNIYSHRSRML